MDFQEARTKVGVGRYTLLNTPYRAKPAGCEIMAVSRVDGRLHITAIGITPMFRGNIRLAENESARTCEDCGNSGGHRRDMQGGKIVTLYDACEVRRTRKFR